MPGWLSTVLGVLVGILVLWLGLLLLLWFQQRRLGRAVDWRQYLRLVPDVVRLLRRLAADATVPRGTRWALGGLLAYLLLPLDLVPDFIPVMGFADDAVVVVLAVRLAVRRAGAEAVERHWPGTPEALQALMTLVRLGRQP